MVNNSFLLSVVPALVAGRDDFTLQRNKQMMVYQREFP